jgi:hypothetical protein
MTYYKVSPSADAISAGAAFEEREVAKKIRNLFNDRYESDYEIEEVENATTTQISNATVIRSLEGI